MVLISRFRLERNSFNKNSLCRKHRIRSDFVGGLSGALPNVSRCLCTVVSAKISSRAMVGQFAITLPRSPQSSSHRTDRRPAPESASSGAPTSPGSPAEWQRNIIRDILKLAKFNP